MFAFKWSKDFDGDGALSFDEYRQIKQTFFDNENFSIGIPYSNAKGFLDKISYTIYENYTGAVIKSEEYIIPIDTRSTGWIKRFPIASNELRLGSYIVNAKYIANSSNVLSSNTAEFKIIEGNSSTREVSYLEKQYRESMTVAVPYGIFFCNFFYINDTLESLEFKGLNKESYSLTMDMLFLAINLPEHYGELIVQAWTINGKLLGVSTKDFQKVPIDVVYPAVFYDSVGTEVIDSILFPKIQVKSEKGSVLDMVRLNGHGEYKIVVSFVNGGTYEKQLVISP